MYFALLFQQNGIVGDMMDRNDFVDLNSFEIKLGNLNEIYGHMLKLTSRLVKNAYRIAHMYALCIILFQYLLYAMKCQKMS